MDFYEQMFNSQYVNRDYYHQLQQQQCQIQYELDQSKKVGDAAKAIEDLCKAVKSLDSAHQQEAFLCCLRVLAKEYNW